MQSYKSSVVDLFTDTVKYMIPLFQRGYVWKLKDDERPQIRYLWEDIADRFDALSLYERDRRKVESELKPLTSHFLGAVVLGPKRKEAGSNIDTREVIDGQQRLTTLQLLFLAFRDVTRGFDDPGLADNLKRVTINPARGRGTPHDRAKVLPMNAGRKDMLAVAEAAKPEKVAAAYPTAPRPLMAQAYLYFAFMIEALLRGYNHDDVVATVRGQERSLADFAIEAIVSCAAMPPLKGEPDLDRAWALHEALASLFEIVELRLDEPDDPQVIFETLNARGEPLKPSDLIRNFVFLEAARRRLDVDRIYDENWAAFDARDGIKGEFWQTEQRQGRFRTTRLDLYMFHYATLRQKRVLKLGAMFEAFKDWWQAIPDLDPETEIARITGFEAPLRRLLDPPGNGAFDAFCRRMIQMDTATHIPVVLAFVEAHGMDSRELLAACLILESFVVRRFVCGLSTNSYSRFFNEMVLPRLLEHGLPRADDLQDILVGTSGATQRWPEEKEFMEAFLTTPLYRNTSSQRPHAILWGLEEELNGANQEYILDRSGVSVEHVLPQSFREADYAFPVGSSPEAKSHRSTLLHSVGNLTLVTPAFNTSLSNDPFIKKRPAIAKESQLRLNAYFQDAGSVWDETTILARANALWPIARAKWSRP